MSTVYSNSDGTLIKVTRYMTGKRPEWAPEEFDSDDDLELKTKKISIKKPGAEAAKVIRTISDTYSFFRPD